MDDVIGPACDKGAVRARKDAAPRDPTLGRWAPGDETAPARERSLSVQRCSYVIESVRTACGAEPA
jgi:hypothetical protein